MFLNFKEYSVLDHIKILSENPETFGAVKTANGESYDVYNITGHTVSVKNNIRPSTLDINIRNNETYETSLSYEYDSAYFVNTNMIQNLSLKYSTHHQSIITSQKIQFVTEILRLMI